MEVNTVTGKEGKSWIKWRSTSKRIKAFQSDLVETLWIIWFEDKVHESISRYMPALRCGLAVWTLGAGLKLLFNQTTHTSIYIIVLAIEGAGVGWVHQPGLVALQANSTDQDRAVATGTRNIFRSLGGVVGIAVSTTTYYTVMNKALGNAVPGWVRDGVLYGSWRTGDSGTSEYERDILNARMRGFRAVFIMSVPLMTVCLIVSLLVADITLKGDNVSEETTSHNREERTELSWLYTVVVLAEVVDKRTRQPP